MSVYLIVESNLSYAAQLKQSILSVQEKADVRLSQSIEDAMSCYQKYQPVLIFLSLDQNSNEVFEFIYRLEELQVNSKLVVMAKDEKLAVKAIRTSVIDYLVKPIKQDALCFCLQRVKSVMKKEKEEVLLADLYGKLKVNKRIRINTRVGFEILKPEEILYCKADRNYTDICRIDGKIVTTSNTLGCIEQQLPTNYFFRIGRSAVINLDYIKSVNRKEKVCELACDGELHKLPLSPNKVQDLAAVLD